ncbi:AraC family transcriptional regulator [Pseudonocardia endophytica]|uniref:AraC family transcriptional regulator n=1 Tax=Pseudonocardia endophytica TaxID=401976 RepID=A0A4V2PJ92_PSEEN|nr:AraC family transcriptional regulator [Pseudonocardia endophytica]TCK27616.1 AraC family transcriptional regulator [Pseudonocardia endophytica]
MPSLELPAEERLRAGDLIARLNDMATAVGPNDCHWPGLTAYRFTSPQSAQWAEVHSLSLCCVLQGRKRVTVDGEEYLYDPFNYLLFTRGMSFEADILEASPQMPFLSFVLQIDPTVVRAVSVDMAQRRTTPFSRPSNPGTPKAAYVSPLEQNLLGAVLRFFGTLNSETDRRVLAPMYLQEITYRLLQADQCVRLLAAAHTENERNPVTELIRHVRARLGEPLTVADMAHAVCLSPTALTNVFTEATGMGPYQFVKKMRLDRASVLLLEQEMNVSEVAKQVGYASVSHFICEFKRYFGTTPRHYREAQRERVGLGFASATERRSHG